MPDAARGEDFSAKLPRREMEGERDPSSRSENGGECFMCQAHFQKAVASGPPSRNSVEIWRFPDISGGEELLDTEEKRRLDAYRSPTARRLFLSGRAGVRLVAARYCGLAPGSFRVRCDERGKPAFIGQPDLHFNLSHSGDVALAAFSGAPVGLDIECRGRSRDFAAIARRFFLPEEAEAVLRSGENREDVFLKIWTAKEAIVKLSGKGLAGGLALARTTPDGQGFLGDQAVWLRHFLSDGYHGTAASFLPFEVKGWFDL